MRMQTIWIALVPLVLSASLGCQSGVQTPSEGETPSALEALIARAKSLELDTLYVPPPGDPLEHHTSGFAKIMCSAVFITGLDADFAAENVGYFTSPYSERSMVSKPVIDRANSAVHITMPNGVTRTAKYLGDQGCVTLPIGEDSVSFTPQRFESRLPDASTRSWPAGSASARCSATSSLVC